MTCPIYMLAPLSKARVAGISPRLRGKDNGIKTTLNSGLGSPTLARERLRVRLFSKVHFRITPACAGKTNSTFSKANRLRDHPRLRGKDYANPQFHVDERGSPPLARERPFHGDGQPAQPRITPACAGKTDIK